MRYSLADYTLSITVPSELSTIGNFSIGGKDNATDNISVELDNDQWSTEAYATGAYVHNRSFARTGKVSISISQLNAELVKLKNFAKAMYDAEKNFENGATLSLSQTAVDSKKNGNVMTATDCYIVKIPAQEFGENAGKQTWVFTCGEITFD